MIGGYIFAILFFLLLAIAAITSTISLQEVITAYISEEFHLSRKKVVAASSLLLMVGAVLASLSLGPKSSLMINGKSLFEVLDFVTSKLFLPFGGLLIALFIGWFYKADDIRDELSNGGKLKSRFFPVYLFLMRYFVPLAILLTGLVILRGKYNGAKVIHRSCRFNLIEW